MLSRLNVVWITIIQWRSSSVNIQLIYKKLTRKKCSLQKDDLKKWTEMWKKADSFLPHNSKSPNKYAVNKKIVSSVFSSSYISIMGLEYLCNYPIMFCVHKSLFFASASYRYLITLLMKNNIVSLKIPFFMELSSTLKWLRMWW